MEIIIYGEPVAQGRPRFNRHTGSAYDPAKSRNYKKLVAQQAQAYKPDELLTGALGMEIDIFRSAPKSISSVKKRQPDLKNERLRPITKPDVDNYAKGVKDALSGLIYKDDSQIVDLRIRKYYSLEPRVVVRAEQLDDLN